MEKDEPQITQITQIIGFLDGYRANGIHGDC